MRTVPITRAACAERLADAEHFLLQAQETVQKQGNAKAVGRVAVSSFVLAGIAAGDVICGVSLGERASGSNHSDGVDLLKKVNDGATHRRHLQTLIGFKTKAQYAAATIGPPAILQAERAATALVQAAQAALR